MFHQKWPSKLFYQKMNSLQIFSKKPYLGFTLTNSFVNVNPNKIYSKIVYGFNKIKFQRKLELIFFKNHLKIMVIEIVDLTL